ncbi:hypothetical protein Tco_0575388 [Tanacetum coccineum]
MNNHILHVHPTESASSSIPDLQRQLYLKMKDDEQAKHDDLPGWLSLMYMFGRPTAHVEPYRVAAVCTLNHEDHHDDDARPKGESSAKRQKTSEHGTYTTSESSSSQAMDELTSSGSGTEEQLEDFNAWNDDQCINDDEVPDEEVSPELLAEVSGKGTTVDDLKRMQEALNDTMRSRCDSEPAPIFSSCARYPSVPPMTLLNQGLFYLKNENSESRKYVVDHWKNLWVKQSHIRRQLIKRDNLEEVYSEHRIVDIIRVQFDQGHGQEYTTEIMVKRANGEYEYFTESDYKYLYKNDIEDIVHDYQLGMESYQQKVNLTTPTLTFPGVGEKKLYTINSDPLVDLIYENNKKEKNIMTIDEIPKFCDATLKRVLEKVKKITLDVKHGYADLDLSDDDAENIRFYEEYIEERLRYRDQMRQWESYVNGRPLRRRWDLQE